MHADEQLHQLQVGVHRGVRLHGGWFFLSSICEELRLRGVLYHADVVGTRLLRCWCERVFHADIYEEYGSDDESDALLLRRRRSPGTEHHLVEREVARQFILFCVPCSAGHLHSHAHRNDSPSLRPTGRQSLRDEEERRVHDDFEVL